MRLLSLRAPWRGRDGEAGLGLIEVIMAMFVLAVALMALGSVAISSLISLRDTRDREQATNAASAAIEDVRSRDYASIVHQPGTVDPLALPEGAQPSSWDPAANPPCLDGEQLATDAVADPVPFERTVGDDGAITVYVIVTYDDDADDVVCTVGDRDLKRVVAVAAWQEAGQRRFVREETLVTEVDRGLPVPRFELRPQSARVNFSYAFLDDEDDERRCVSHQLRNLGAEDSYDWELVKSTDTGEISPSFTYDSYEVGEWRVTAFLEFDPTPEPRGTKPAPDEARMAFEAGEPRPLSNLRITPGGVALLTVCYEPRTGTALGGPYPSDIATEVVLRSRFDERQERSVQHTITVVDQAAPGTPLYLFDRDDTTAHPRQVTQNSKTLFVPSVMGPLASEGSDPSLINQLSTHTYGAADANWSTDIVADHLLPGIRLQQPASVSESREVSATTAAWHYQFPADTTLLPNATLLLWVAPVTALQNETLSEPVALDLEIRLDGLAKNEKNVAWPGFGKLVTYVHTTSLSSVTNGWQQVEIPLELGGEIDFPANDYLRLRITCAPSSAEDCNLAYDNTAFQSALFVQVR